MITSKGGCRNSLQKPNKSTPAPAAAQSSPDAAHLILDPSCLYGQRARLPVCSLWGPTHGSDQLGSIVVLF